MSGSLAEMALAELAADSGLTPLASASWPDPAGDEAPPALPGFIMSTFSPLVAEVAERCLRAHHGAAPAQPERGARTAVIIASASGDLGTALRLADAVDSGARVAPLLFFQAVPNAVAGYVAARWGLAGPVVCVAPADDSPAEAFAVASLIIRDGDADEALIVFVEQSGPADRDDEPGGDTACALLVRPETAGAVPC